MRAVFGLVGVLVGLGVLVWWLGARGGGLDETKAVLDAGDKARTEVSQIAGRNADGSGRADESATFDLQSTNGSFDGLLVTDVQANGAYAKFWGLKTNDFITKIGDESFKGGQITSDEDAKNTMLDAYQHQRPLTIMRDGVQMQLPLPAPPGQRPKERQNTAGFVGHVLDAAQESQDLPSH
jgi:hypothetical protein